MPSKLISRRSRFRTAFVVSRTVLALATAGLAMASVQAAEWGRARLLSGVGQPLNIEVPLRDLPSGLVPGAAAVQVQAGHATDAGLADRVAMPVQGRLQPRADGQPGMVLVIASTEPVPRGVVDLAIALDLPQGAERRRLVLLLSPARGAAVTPISLAGVAGQRTIRVQPGDTLGGIVARLRAQPGHDAASVHQWLVALYQANPAAFLQNNLNLVRAGATLQVPDATAVRALDVAAARQLVAAHMRDFAALRGQVVRQAPAMAPAAAVPAGQGQVSAAAAAPAAVTPARDTLRLSSLLPGNGTAHAATRDPQAVIDQLRDERAATQRALAEARARVGELESTVADMERLLTLQNETLARLQDAGSATGGATAGAANAVMPAASPSVAVAPAGGAAGAASPGAAGAAGRGAIPAPVASGPTNTLAVDGVVATDSAAPGPGAGVASAATPAATPAATLSSSPGGQVSAPPPAGVSAASAQAPAPAEAMAGGVPAAAATVGATAPATVAPPVPVGVAGTPVPAPGVAVAPAGPGGAALTNLGEAGGAGGTPAAGSPEVATTATLRALETPPPARPQDGAASPSAASPAAMTTPAATTAASDSGTATGPVGSDSATASPPAKPETNPAPAAPTSAAPTPSAAASSGGAATAAAAGAPEAPDTTSWTVWGLAALVVFALAVVGYLLRRRPTAVLDDDAEMTSSPGAPLPPLKVDFDLDLDPPSRAPSAGDTSGPGSRP